MKGYAGDRAIARNALNARLRASMRNRLTYGRPGGASVAPGGKVATRTRTGTKTMTKKKPKYEKGEISGEFGEDFFVHTDVKLSKTMFKVIKNLPYVTYHINNSGQHTCNDGEANYQTYTSSYTATQAQLICNLSEGTAVGDKTRNAIMLGCKGNIAFANRGQASLKLALYEIAYKRDSSSNAQSLFVNSIQAGGGSATDYTMVGLRPNMGYQFRQSCKVDKVTEVWIQPGGIFTHYFNYKIKKMWNNSMSYDLTDEYLRGWTRDIFGIIHGKPTHDVGLTNFTTADCAMDWVATRTFKVKFLEQSSTVTNTYEDNLPTGNTLTVRGINQDTGAAEDLDTGT